MPTCTKSTLPLPKMIKSWAISAVLAVAVARALAPEALAVASANVATKSDVPLPKMIVSPVMLPVVRVALATALSPEALALASPASTKLSLGRI